MIWGRNTKEWREKHKKPHRWYAWYPVCLVDGRWAWLTHVTRRLEFHWEGSSYYHWLREEEK